MQRIRGRLNKGMSRYDGGGALVRCCILIRKQINIVFSISPSIYGLNRSCLPSPNSLDYALDREPLIESYGQKEASHHTIILHTTYVSSFELIVSKTLRSYVKPNRSCHARFLFLCQSFHIIITCSVEVAPRENEMRMYVYGTTWVQATFFARGGEGRRGGGQSTPELCHAH